MSRTRLDASNISGEMAASSDRSAVLAAFRRALAREMHPLRRHPGLLWQQLHNRLQWEDDLVRAVLAPEFERRSVPGVTPWLRTRTRSWESEALVRTLEGHSWMVEACAFSPDGARVVSASNDKTLKLWDAETGQEIRTLKGHTKQVHYCAFSPDGARVVSASLDKTVKLWDAETGRELRTFKGHTEPVDDCAFSPDGARVVSASRDTTLQLWDAETGQEIRTLKGHTYRVNACAFSPDGARVVSASDDRTLKLWDAETGECLATLPLLDGTRPRAAAHHPHRAIVACGDHSGSFYLVELVGISLGPLVVTAVDFGNGPSVRCPACFKRHPLQQAWLGRELDCPGSACHARLRVNPFVVRRAPAAGS